MYGELSGDLFGSATDQPGRVAFGRLSAFFGRILVRHLYMDRNLVLANQLGASCNIEE